MVDQPISRHILVGPSAQLSLRGVPACGFRILAWCTSTVRWTNRHASSSNDNHSASYYRQKTPHSRVTYILLNTKSFGGCKRSQCNMQGPLNAIFLPYGLRLFHGTQGHQRRVQKRLSILPANVRKSDVFPITVAMKGHAKVCLHGPLDYNLLCAPMKSRALG